MFTVLKGWVVIWIWLLSVWSGDMGRLTSEEFWRKHRTRHSHVMYTLVLVESFVWGGLLGMGGRDILFFFFHHSMWHTVKHIMNKNMWCANSILFISGNVKGANHVNINKIMSHLQDMRGDSLSSGDASPQWHLAHQKGLVQPFHLQYITQSSVKEPEALQF